MIKCFVTALLLASCSLCMGQLRVAKIFSDSMVLQRDMPVPVWGWANRNEKVTVQFNGQSKTGTAGNDGRWSVQLDPQSAGGPYTLVVSSSPNTVSFHEILMGDVWVCSGQSNMEFAVSGAVNAAAEIQQADFLQIRHFALPKDVSQQPLDDLSHAAGWQAATPGNVKNFTAVGYFFARELYKQLHVPIGLIHTSWGGTDIETWISREALSGSREFHDLTAQTPLLNLDSVLSIRNKALTSMVLQLQGSLPQPGATNSWKEAATDDHAWPQMQLPSMWEQKQLKDLDGTVWFRKTIVISAADAGKEAVLHLGVIDDADDCYVNGQKVGSTHQYNLQRNYKIPAGVLKEGPNVIAVRVEDTGGNGGLYGATGDMNITTGSAVMPLAGDWRFQVESITRGTATLGPNRLPSLLYNAMINPIIPFGIKGVLWYQGENNASRAYQYRTAFPLMINDWRSRWKEGNFPFYFVQLASFKASGGTSVTGSSWAELREAQALTLSLPNTGMAVTTDIGMTNDIHPKNKQDVGKRLAAVALHDTYHKNNVFSGPVYKSMKTDGSKVIVSFSQVNGGLLVKGGSATTAGFEVAGADQQFHAATAQIEGDHVIVTSDAVSNPVAVRYGWADDAGTSSLFNKEGFPAAPFRTDNWKSSTFDQHYKIQ